MNDKFTDPFEHLNLPEPEYPNGDALGEIPDASILDSHRVNLNTPPGEPLTVIRLIGQQISTAGNLTVIGAQAKAGKSAVVGAMIAAMIASRNTNASATGKLDLLGFCAAPVGDKAVVVFDTEQTPYDAWALVNRAVIRARAEVLPENFRCYHLADVATRKRRHLLRTELQRAKAGYGGIHCVIIDGVADLCIDPNNTEEAFGLVEELIQYAIEYVCPIVLVIHENPSEKDTAKTRGHLGSHLVRKAESNLRVWKGTNGVSTIYSVQCRKANIPKERGSRFLFDTELGMHVTVANRTEEDKLEERREKGRLQLDGVFCDRSELLGYSTLMQRIQK